MSRYSPIYFSLVFLLGLQLVLADSVATQELKKVRLAIRPLDFARVISGSRRMKACSKNMVLMWSRFFYAAGNWRFRPWPAAIRR
jgi:hypothetical protein